MTERKLPVHIAKKYPTMSSDDLLEEFEKWANLCHYDPHGQAGDFNPFEVANCLRAEVLNRMFDGRENQQPGEEVWDEEQ